MSEYKLTEEIIRLSKANNWDEAKLEWELEDVYWQSESEECLCGHSPINEICILRNTKNDDQVTVGNYCVKKFLDLPSGKIFDAIRRIKKDDSKALNGTTIGFAQKRGWIEDWECAFYYETMHKRRLEEWQLPERKKINHKILDQVNQARKIADTIDGSA